MKAIAVNGSPRRNGNTFFLLSIVLKELEARGVEVEMIQAGGRNLHGCTGCDQCRKQGLSRCVYDDDLINESIKAISEADALILGSPVYVGGVTAQMKAFIDRVGHVTRPRKILRGKLCASVAVARRNGALAAFNTMNNLFLICEGVVVGSDYWNQGVGREIGDVENDKEGIETMRTLGRNMADLLFALKK